MKIVLYMDGEPGQAVFLSDEDPMAHMEEMLGGAVELTPLDESLCLVTLEDGEERRLPIRYGLHRLGRAVEPIAGDCAVVARTREGWLRNARERDIRRADGYVWAVEAKP